MIPLKVLKSDPAAGQPMEQMVWAEVYAPNRPDSDGEFMTASTIKKMAYDFARKSMFEQVDVQHDNATIPGVQIVESFIARKGDPDFIEGSWVVGIHINHPETWDKVVKGELNGLSVQAMVGRVEHELELELPPVVSGQTSKSEDHTHEFFVNYDEAGTFRGGRTGYANGHSHVIKTGTVTEEANGHTHRFSAVDPIEIVF